jgi:hypothetical protein
MVRRLAVFVATWFAFALVAFYETGLFGAAAVGLGGSERDIREMLEMFSVPLGWINPSLIVRRDTSTVTAFAIIFLNAFFWTVPVFAAWRIVRFFSARSKTTTLGLGQTDTPPDDDEDL